MLLIHEVIRFRDSVFVINTDSHSHHVDPGSVLDFDWARRNPNGISQKLPRHGPFTIFISTHPCVFAHLSPETRICPKMHPEAPNRPFQTTFAFGEGGSEKLEGECWAQNTH